MKTKKILGLFMSAVVVMSILSLAGCKEKDDPAADSTDYKVQYSLRVITDNAKPLGRDEIVDMAKNALAPMGITLTQKSESVWGYEAAYPEQLSAAQALYEQIDDVDVVPDLDEVPGLLFYGTIEEDLRIMAGNQILDRELDSERYTLPQPNRYRYVINRDVWDVKSFEIDPSTPLTYADDFSSCFGYVKVNGGDETRMAYFTAAGVDVYKAQSRTEVEGRIIYMIENNTTIKGFLSVLDGSSVNMPITLELR